jgi:hypothetical protein
MSSSPLAILAITKAANGKQDLLRAVQEKLVAETLRVRPKTLSMIAELP